MKYGHLRKDDDSHWYVIPENLVPLFDDISEKIEQERDEEKQWDLQDEFNDNFSKYRINYPIGYLKVLMEE